MGRKWDDCWFAFLSCSGRKLIWKLKTFVRLSTLHVIHSDVCLEAETSPHEELEASIEAENLLPRSIGLASPRLDVLIPRLELIASALPRSCHFCLASPRFVEVDVETSFRTSKLYVIYLRYVARSIWLQKLYKKKQRSRCKSTTSPVPVAYPISIIVPFIPETHTIV